MPNGAVISPKPYNPQESPGIFALITSRRPASPSQDLVLDTFWTFERKEIQSLSIKKWFPVAKASVALDSKYALLPLTLCSAVPTASALSA